MAAAIETVIDELADRLNLTEPADDHDIAAAAAPFGRPLPAELELLLRRGGFGALLDSVDVFSRHVFADVNREREPHLPSAVFFASDGGDGFFFIDADGSLGPGPGAVLWSDRSTMRPADCVPCAPSLAEFLRAVAGGEQPWRQDDLRKIDLRGMKQALERQRARLAFNGGIGFSAISDAGRRIGVALPPELDALLRISDGLVIPTAGVTLYRAADLQPIDGATANGRPGAIWFAEGGGRRFAVTVFDWREPDGGQVIGVAPGESPLDAPIIGSLPSVVTAWLEQGAKS